MVADEEHGGPLRGSMYRYLWPNGSNEVLEFADYVIVVTGHYSAPNVPE